MSIYLSTYLSTYLSIHLSICLSICLSIYLSIHPSIYLELILHHMHICDRVFIACRIPTPHIHIFQWANVWKWGTWTVCPNFWHGWWYTDPSEKYDFVSWDDEIPNIWKNDPTHQPDHLFYLWTNTVSAGLIRLPTGNQTWFDGKSAVFFQGFPSELNLHWVRRFLITTGCITSIISIYIPLVLVMSH